MAERCFLFPSLTATETLQVLASLAARSDAVEVARLRVRPDGEGYVRLILPDPFVQTGSAAMRKQREDMFAALQAAVAAALGRPADEEEAHLDADGPSLQEPLAALPRLLLESGWRREGERAEPIPGEAVVLLPSEDEEAAWAVFDRLNTHATAVRVTAARPAGAEAAGTPGIHLFHLRDDEERVSSFQGLRTSGFLDGVLDGGAVLEGFAVAGKSVFLPSGHAPDRRALDFFLQAVAAAARLAPDASGPVLALTVKRTETGALYDLYPLNRLRFRDKTALWPAAAADGGTDLVRIHDLSDSETMAAALADRIRAAEPLVGYELELRPGYLGPGAETSLQRVQEKVAYYTELAAYLSGLARPQPVLMRFSDRQLPALADAIRRFPFTDIDEGRVRYGFHATGADDGVHYLLVSPDDTAQDSPLPEALWRDRLGADPMVFQVDPFFARFYDAARPRSLVFVPERAALPPPLHSWNPADIDDYLRDTLSSWFHGRHGAQAIPAEPFYLFRHDDSGSGRGPGGAARVVVEVLDAAAFVPLRRRIGWLNRTLELRHRLDLDDMIATLADKAGRAALADRVAAEEQAAVTAFDEAARTVERHVGGHLEEMLEVLGTEASVTAQRASAASQTLDRLYADLNSIDAAVADLTARTRSVEGAMAELDLARGDFTAHRARLEGRVTSAIEDADSALATLERAVNERIQRLKGTYERLSATLGDLRSGE